MLLIFLEMLGGEIIF